MKEYERGSWDVARKAVPNFRWDYQGEHPEDAGYNPNHKCRICGRPMFFYQMKGNIAQYACDGIGCANNPDSYWNTKFDYNSVTDIGNPSLIWSLPKPIY